MYQTRDGRWRCKASWTEWIKDRPVTRSVTGEEKMKAVNALMDALVAAQRRRKVKVAL